MKLLILVLSYNDNGIYSEFYETQKKTWDSVKVSDIETYYYFGNSEENLIRGNNIHVTEIEDSKCTSKLISALKLIKDFEFDVMFRTNSSSYIDKKLLYDFLLKINRDNFYSGFIGTNNGFEFSSGAGFCLSKNLIELLIENENMIDRDLIDDISIAKTLKNFNILPIECGFARWDYGFSSINDPNFLNYFHYRLKTNNRIDDVKFMNKIFKLKNEFYNREQI